MMQDLHVTIHIEGYAKTLVRWLDFESVASEWLESALAQAAMPLEMQFAKPSAEVASDTLRVGVYPFVLAQHGVVTAWQSPHSELAAP